MWKQNFHNYEQDSRSFFLNKISYSYETVTSITATSVGNP